MIGWCNGVEGNAKEAVAEIEAGLETWRRQGSELGRSFFLCALAETCERTGERLFEAERLRLFGEYGLASKRLDPAAAEAHFNAAATVAREKGANLLELRAAMSLLRHATSPKNVQSARARMLGCIAAIKHPELIREVAMAKAVGTA